MNYKYRSLIKRLRFEIELKGLIPKGMPFDMKESKDLEGYPGCVAVGYVFEEGIFHPQEAGMQVVHPHDELLIFAGTYWDDLLKLGAEVSITLGSETYVIRESSVVIVPKGTPHGPCVVRNLEAPLVHIMLCNGLSYEAEYPIYSRIVGQGLCQPCQKAYYLKERL